MSEHIKESWLSDLITTYNMLGGSASYTEIYPIAEKVRRERGASWTAQSKATIRRTVEDHSKDSRNFRGKSVFYSVKGLGKGVWALLPEYLHPTEKSDVGDAHAAYLEGIEGIVQESRYLRKSRSPQLVEERKKVDDFTCQVCGFRNEVGEDKFVIDVHHLSPLGQLNTITITQIEDLICLCPTCHRIAHSRKNTPLTPDEVSAVLKSGK